MRCCWHSWQSIMQTKQNDLLRSGDFLSTYPGSGEDVWLLLLQCISNVANLIQSEIPFYHWRKWWLFLNYWTGKSNAKRRTITKQTLHQLGIFTFCKAPASLHLTLLSIRAAAEFHSEWANFGLNIQQPTATKWILIRWVFLFFFSKISSKYEYISLLPFWLDQPAPQSRALMLFLPQVPPH